jgi:hypothetical protein
LYYPRLHGKFGAVTANEEALMVAEWLAAIKPLSDIASIVTSNIDKYRALHRDDRTKLADRLDDIATQLKGIAAQMGKEPISYDRCEKIVEYSKQLPALIEKAHDRDVAKRIARKLKSAHNAKSLAMPGTQSREQLAKLVKIVEGAAGSASATADVLRTM